MKYQTALGGNRKSCCLLKASTIMVISVITNVLHIASTLIVYQIIPKNYIETKEDTCPTVNAKAFDDFFIIESAFLLPNVFMMLVMIYYQYINTEFKKKYGDGNFHILTWINYSLALESWYSVNLDVFSDAIVIALCQAYANYATDEEVKLEF